MRKRNKVAQLARTHSHRKAMMSNMAVSLLKHERIKTTRTKAKVLRSYVEPLITRAKICANSELSEEKVLHHKRQVMKYLRDWDIVRKLFDDIGTRYVSRPGGYVRLIHLADRVSDAAPMTLVELMDRKTNADKVKTKDDEQENKEINTKATKKIEETSSKSQPKKTGKQSKDFKDIQSSNFSNKNQSWYDKFMRKRNP